MNKRTIEKRKKEYLATLEVVKNLSLIEYMIAHIEANAGGDYFDPGGTALGEYSMEVPEFDQAVQVVQQALTVIVTREFIKKRKGLE
jgi:hypothetical protein